MAMHGGAFLLFVSKARLACELARDGSHPAARDLTSDARTHAPGPALPRTSPYIFFRFFYI